MPHKNITAQNDTLEIILPRKCNGAALVYTPAQTTALANFVLEHSVLSSTGTDEWLGIELFNPATKLDALSLTGPSLAGWAEVPSMRKIRARRTDANGGAGWVGLEFREG